MGQPVHVVIEYEKQSNRCLLSSFFFFLCLNVLSTIQNIFICDLKNKNAIQILRLFLAANALSMVLCQVYSVNIY